MGRSTPCFKIISFGSDPDDAVNVRENKKSSGNKGWSFRNRSEWRQLLTEKTSTLQYTEEKPQLLTLKECIEEKSQLVALKEYTEEKSQLLTPLEYREEKS
ncbi:hypothetical protein PTKIN_Ptkin09bG0207300 [Pterospermum kingtungense]